MIEHLTDPIGNVLVYWLSADAGGRRSGPPAVPVYAANCAFPLGAERDLIPGWPATAVKYSIFLERTRVEPDGGWICDIDFVAPGLVAEFLRRDAPMLIMEGPKVVAESRILEIYDPG